MLPAKLNPAIMPDTTVTKLIIGPLDSSQSHLITNSIDSLRHTIVEVGSSGGYDWTALISAMIGGLLVIVGQVLLEARKSKIEKAKELDLILADLVKLKWNIKNLFEQLSNAKIDCEYYEFCHKKHTEEDIKNALRKDYQQAQSLSRKLWQNIGETRAQFLSHITRFERIYHKPINLEEELDNLNSFHTVDTKPYDTTLSIEEVRDTKLAEDIKFVKGEYSKNIEKFDKIIDKIKTLK